MKIPNSKKLRRSNDLVELLHNDAMAHFRFPFTRFFFFFEFRSPPLLGLKADKDKAFVMVRGPGQPFTLDLRGRAANFEFSDRYGRVDFLENGFRLFLISRR